MKTSLPIIAAVLAIMTIVIAGCQKKPDASGELEKAVKALEQADSGQQAAAAAAQPLPPTGTPAATPAQPTPAAASTQVAQQMNQAVTSYKGGNYEDAVTRLQWLRARKANTPEQIMALQQATAAVMGEIYARAAQGDARAKQAVKEYERLQTTAH